MQFNNGKERLAFEKEWEEKRKLYSELGMSEDATNELYEFDLDEFNSSRRYCEHCEPIGDIPESDLSSGVLDLERYGTRYWWINEIHDERLLEALNRLPKEDLELLTMHVFENYTQQEIAKALGISQPAISYRLKNIKVFCELFGKMEK